MKRFLFIMVSILFGNLLFAQKAELRSDIYVGIVSFAANAEDITGDKPVLLNKMDKLDGTLDNYKRAKSQGTALYYAVHKALVNLKNSELVFPPNVEAVSLLIFTDGVDNNSTSMALAPIEATNSFSGKQEDEYLEYDREKIKTIEIVGRHISAYAIGVPGSDVRDRALFNKALEDLVGKEYYKPLENFDELAEEFTKKAKGLTRQDKKYSFTVKTPSYPIGTTVRVTFDKAKSAPVGVAEPADTEAPEVLEGENSEEVETVVPEPVELPQPTYTAESEQYLEGTVDFRNRKYILTNLQYKGLSSADFPIGAAVNGLIDGTEISYTFVNLEGYDPAAELVINQWSKKLGAQDWQINTEYSFDDTDLATDTVPSYKSLVIYLVLDSSTSMSDENIKTVRDAAKNFIHTLYNTLKEQS